MYPSTSSIVVVLLIIVQVLITSAQLQTGNWAQPYYRGYDDDDDSTIANIGWCLISPGLAYKIGVIRGEKQNENDGAAAYSVRECALRADPCGGVANTDCVNCFLIENLASCTSINGCSAEVGFCAFSCP
ncbi:uncharacterized protein LOC117343648 [Pecten maximus]|uniref:uncharacterized protein LOC117343648 n=1 Tax=Pecten maximus TaxID=6579 RepID=UPI0014586579|nr:uncharacterized protein LOC117343648 [Pecten maximus]